MDNLHSPKIAVLLAAYNGMQWIEEQVESILAQESVDVTLFVSVDRSTDGTEQWVEALADSNPKVVMLPYGERFGGAGPNFFRLVCDVDLSAFDAVAFADQDDIWFSGKLKRAFSFLATGQYDVISSDVIAFWPDGVEKRIKKSYNQKKYDHFFEAAGPGCTYVFGQAAIHDFKNFLLDLGEKRNSIALHDWLAYAFCRNKGYVWFIDSQPSMRYRQHENNQVGTNTGLKAYRKRLQMVRQHWYRRQVYNIIHCVNPEFSTQISSYFFRVRHAFSMRRRPRDVLAILFMFLFGLY
jgi:rhamnosyltransferase